MIEDHDKEVLSVIDEDVVYVYEYEEDIWKMTNGAAEETGYEGAREETKEQTNGEGDGDTAKNDGSETEESDELEEDEDMFERLKGTED